MWSRLQLLETACLLLLLCLQHAQLGLELLLGPQIDRLAAQRRWCLLICRAD